MVARRRQILETAQAMLARDDGSFTMRGLARESGVATATIYNLYGSQDAVIADAVADIFERRVNGMADMPENATFLEAAIARQEAAHREIMREPAFARKMVELYFDAGPGGHVRNMLHGEPSDRLSAQLADLLDKGLVEDWVDVHELADQITRATYAVIALWAAGDIPDNAMSPAVLRSTFALVAGALKGTAREEVVAFLEKTKPGQQADRAFGT
jgi:AcrR family transcriptional regulator